MPGRERVVGGGSVDNGCGACACVTNDCRRHCRIPLAVKMSEQRE